MSLENKKSPDYQRATFLLSVAYLTQLPPDEGYEVAIIGRSNAGKSSVLNQLTQNKKLARVSKTPGRTQFLNVFKLDEDRRIVDLPGYGYADVPLKMKQQWERRLDNYLQQRACLRGLVLVMDSRHPLQPFDVLMLDWAAAASVPVHVLLNKSDKLAYGALRNQVLKVSKTLQESYGELVSCQAFSAVSGKGLKELQVVLDGWFL